MAPNEETSKDGTKTTSSQIIDIRSDTALIGLKRGVLTGLHPQDGEEKTLPTLLLYDDRGLRLFEDITYLEEYYLTGQEIAVLNKHADSIAARIPNEAMVVELGSGNLRKIKILLNALERAKKDVTYFALDLVYDELVRTLSDVPEGTYKHVKCVGLWGTYDDGLLWLKRPENTRKTKAVLSMGSSIGNFTPNEAIEFITQFAEVLGPNDKLLIALDGCQDPDKVYPAYHDRDDVTHTFTINGLNHANNVLEHKAFDLDEWEPTGEYLYDRNGSRHRAFVVPKTTVVVEGATIKKGEKVRIEESYKWTPHEAAKLFRRSKTIVSEIFPNEVGTYALYLLNPSKMITSTKPEEYAAHPVPSMAEWVELWAIWDMVTRQMIPDEELMDKPIKLRNACIFYLGHIPTFLDMKLTEVTSGQPTEPSFFYKIFERGIDPDVDNPEQCHAHSEVPEAWPNLEEILGFQKRVRERVAALYESGEAYNNNWTGRTLWLGLEHEMMHLETLLYMLVQSEKTLPPKGSVRPEFKKLALQAKKEAVENEWFDIPEQYISIGLDDPDNANDPTRYFGWDVEKPPYDVKVKAFKAKARPITNGEYVKYLVETSNHQLPASWTETHAQNGVNESNGYQVNGDTALYDFMSGKAVRTVYGPVPLKYALEWPVAASYDELVGCAKYMGGRIPTLEEARSIYYHAAMLKKKEAAKALGCTIPAVNSHLVNEGVEETPPPKHFIEKSSSTQAGPHPKELFASLEDANVGFKNWHPTPVTHNGGKLAGIGEMGGLWEWTGSVLEKINGFEPMKLYPAYSADFYDEKHNIVLGGSWATLPRIAGRNTFVNWYQRNYPYVWAGARVVKDA